MNENMSVTTLHAVVSVQNLTLAVFYTDEAEAWQFRILSAGGIVFGESKIYFSPEAAERAGREWIEAGR
jgi:hypothetical protein